MPRKYESVELGMSTPKRDRHCRGGISTPNNEPYCVTSTTSFLELAPSREDRQN